LVNERLRGERVHIPSNVGMKRPPEVGGRGFPPSPHFVPSGQAAPAGNQRVARRPWGDLAHYAREEGLPFARGNPAQFPHRRRAKALPG
ncbi:unnamed protein product, partial [Musa textilis]